MNRIRAFFSNYYTELATRVTWPKPNELSSNTITVLTASIILAMVIALFDFVFSTALTALYDLFQ